MFEENHRVFILSCCLAVAGVWATITTSLAGRYKAELGEARLELERVRADALALEERQLALDGNLGRAREIVRRQSESVSGAIGTVADIRACLADIRAYTQELENCLRGDGGGGGAGDNGVKRDFDNPP